MKYLRCKFFTYLIKNISQLYLWYFTKQTSWLYQFPISFTQHLNYCLQTAPQITHSNHLLHLSTFICQCYFTKYIIIFNTTTVRSKPSKKSAWKAQTPTEAMTRQQHNTRKRCNITVSMHICWITQLSYLLSFSNWKCTRATQNVLNHTLKQTEQSS